MQYYDYADGWEERWSTLSMQKCLKISVREKEREREKKKGTNSVENGINNSSETRIKSRKKDFNQHRAKGRWERLFARLFCRILFSILVLWSWQKCGSTKVNGASNSRVYDKVWSVFARWDFVGVKKMKKGRRKEKGWGITDWHLGVLSRRDARKTARDRRILRIYSCIWCPTSTVEFCGSEFSCTC